MICPDCGKEMKKGTGRIMNTASAPMTILYKNEQKEDVEFTALPGFDQPMYYCDDCKQLWAGFKKNM